MGARRVTPALTAAGALALRKQLPWPAAQMASMFGMRLE